MRLEQIQAFLAIAETGSFQKAARQCGVTQSTISRQIQSLESVAGLPLFHRGAQAKLTVAGDHLMPRARKIWHEWRQATEDLDQLRLGQQQELCVAAIASLCANSLPPILEKFRQDYPHTQLRVTSLGSDRALKVLRDGLVDIAIVMNNPFLLNTAELFVKPLYEESIQVLMSAQHPLVPLREIPWAEIAKFPQVVFKDGYGMQRLVQEQFQRQDLNLQVAVELNTLDAFRGVVRQGKSIALLPQTALIEALDDPTLVVRPLAKPHVSRQVVLVTTHDRLQIPPIHRFCEITQELLIKPNLPAAPVSNLGPFYEVVPR
ncbi:MAG: LysR family transcriptional regulator [Synechococcales cyanobacterium CRU_2_2]|nr:LysR family transcriptional regulator [Synechococcales cyanobacterium CRU_2_2]